MMTKLRKKYQPILILLGLTVLLISCEKSKEPSTQNKDQMFVFELEKLTTNMNTFNSLVENLNGKGEGTFIQDEESKALIYTDDKANIYFEQDPSTGNLSFNRGIHKYLGDFKPDLPIEDKAEVIAIDYLKDNKLMAGSRKELKLLHSGGLRADSPTGKGVIDKMRTITYGRVLDGIPVIGSGSKIVVHIGDKGNVTGLVHKWREVSQANKRAVSKKEMISEKMARQSFGKVVASEFGKNSKATINSIKLIYYDGDGNFIQPAYGVESTVEIKLAENTVNRIPYLSILPALKQPPEAITLLRTSEEASRLLNKPADKVGKPNETKNMD